jgi:hypothetical protein
MGWKANGYIHLQNRVPDQGTLDAKMEPKLISPALIFRCHLVANHPTEIAPNVGQSSMRVALTQP